MLFSEDRKEQEYPNWPVPMDAIIKFTKKSSNGTENERNG